MKFTLSDKFSFLFEIGEFLLGRPSLWALPAIEFLDTPNTTSQVYYQMYSGFYSENSRINEEIQSQDGDHDARPITTLSISELSSTIL